MSMDNPYEASDVGLKPSSPRRDPALGRVVVRHLDVLSVAKLQAAIFFVLGLIVSVLYGLATLLMAVGLTAGQGDAGAVGGLAFGLIGGLLLIVFGTLLYAVMGFIAGAIFALIYNAAAGLFGGLIVDLESIGY